MLGIKFQIDATRLSQLINRENSDLGDAFVSDIEDKIPMTPTMKTLAIGAFESGYAAALSAVTSLLEPL